MKYLICLLFVSVTLTGCKPAAGDSQGLPLPDSLPGAVDSVETNPAGNNGYPVYWTDSIADPKAWINSDMLMTEGVRGLDTFMLDGGEFHKSLEPTMRALQVNGKGSKEVVVDFAFWTSWNDYDTEKDEQRYFRDEERKCIEIYDVDAGKLIFSCCYYKREVIEENNIDSIPGQVFTHKDSTYYEYTVDLDDDLEITDLKGYSEPDYTPGRYIWKGTGFVKVKLD